MVGSRVGVGIERREEGECLKRGERSSNIEFYWIALFIFDFGRKGLFYRGVRELN